MTLQRDASPLSIDKLGPPDLPEVFAFLDRDAVLNVYLMALLLRDALAAPRDEYWAARRDGLLVGLVHLGGSSGAVLPLGEDDAALRILGGQAQGRLLFLPRRFQVIGPRQAVAPFLGAFGAALPPPRIHRDQVYMTVTPDALPAFERLPGLRPASRDDYALVHDSGAALRAEELEEDPRAVDAIGYARRVEEECRDGHTYLWLDAQGLRFRASVSAATADAAQIAGVYTPPGHRGRGYATRGVAELATRLFERSRAACLFVNDFNAAALAVYRKLGFRVRAAWISAFYDLSR